MAPAPAGPSTGCQQENRCAKVSPVSGGSSVRHRSVARLHRGANRHPGGGSDRSGGSPPMLSSRCLLSWSSRGIDASRAWVYGWRMCRNRVPVSVASTIRPAYMTWTRSACPAITPMSCVISSIAMPSRSFRSCSRARICAWIVTSSAVVGSSAISSLGSQVSAIAIITRWRSPPESWCG